MGKRVYGVLLYDEAYTELAGAIDPYVSKGPIGNYIYCSLADTSGSYFRMIVDGKGRDGNSFEAEVQVPHRYVKFVVVFPQDANIGFSP